MQKLIFGQKNPGIFTKALFLKMGSLALFKYHNHYGLEHKYIFWLPELKV
jgi:hypothetical protein